MPRQRFFESAERVLKADSSELAAAVAEMEFDQPAFLEFAERRVAKLEQYGSEGLDRIYILEWSGTIISVLVSLLAFVYAILPAFKRIRADNKELNEENAHLSTSGEEVRSSLTQIVALKESLELASTNYRIFVEQAPGAIAMFDKDMKYIAASSKWYQDYGLTGQAIIGRSHYDVFPEIGEDWKRIHRECMAGAINRNEDAPFERADGTLQWITWDVRPWRTIHGDIGGIIMYTGEITEVKNLRIEQRRLQMILEKISQTARIGAWEVDLNTNTVYWSKVTRMIHEVPEDYVPDLQTAIQFYKEGESRDKVNAAVAKAIEQGVAYDMEVELVTATGKIIWARAVGQAEWVNGKCVRLLGVFQDIHAQKQQEFRIQKLLSELEIITQSATEISIIATDTSGLITYFSRGAEKLLQYSADEMEYLQTPALIHDPAEVAARGRELTQLLGRETTGFATFVSSAKEGRSDTREWTYVRKDGTSFRVLLSVTPLKDTAGNTVGFLGVGTDLTEINRLKDSIVEANNSLEVIADRLAKQNMQLASFAHITSHNLRAPVSNLNSLLHFYKDSNDQEDRDQLMLRFEKVIEHLTSTLETLVASLQIREGNSAREQVSLSGILTKTLEICTAQITESNATVISDFSQIDKVDYRPDFMDSIFLNLITNSIKYRAADRAPVIEVRSAKTSAGVTLVFSDNGSGIDLMKHGEKVFGLNKTFHRHKDARGVGLFITKTQIESMGGRINVRSEVGEGTTFEITL